VHSGAYSLTNLELRMQLCAHAGVWYKFITARSPISKVKAKMDTEVTKARIPATVNFMVGKCPEEGGEVIV
jgi:hypothetical protein